MSQLQLIIRNLFKKATVTRLFLLFAYWLLLFWGFGANLRYLVGTSPDFWMAGLSLALLIGVSVYRFRKGFLTPGPAAASLVITVVLVWCLKKGHETHLGPGAGILFVPFFLGLFAAFCADAWSAIKEAVDV